MARFMYLSLTIVLWVAVRRRSGVALPVVDADTKSLAEWATLPSQTLRLVCNALNLIDSGSPQILARRLFLFYNPPNLVAATSVTTTCIAPITSTNVATRSTRPRTRGQQTNTATGVESNTIKSPIVFTGRLSSTSTTDVSESPIITTAVVTDLIRVELCQFFEGHEGERIARRQVKLIIRTLLLTLLSLFLRG